MESKMIRWKARGVLLGQGGMTFLVARVPLVCMNPIAIAMFIAMYAGRTVKKMDRLVLLLSTVLGVISCMTYSESVKYGIGLLLVLAVEESIRRKGHLPSRMTMSVLGAVSIMVLNLSNVVFQIQWENALLLAVLESVIILTLPQLLQKGSKVLFGFPTGKIPGSEDYLSFIFLIAIASLGIPQIVMDQYSLRGVFLYLLVLLLGYKYGVGYGSVAGAAMGIVAAIQGSAIQIGIFCLLGVTAGLLRTMTRFASGFGFAGAGLILPIVCMNQLPSMDLLRSVLSAVGIFLLLPGKLLCPLREGGSGRFDVTWNRQNYQKLAGSRIREFASAFQVLANSIYGSTEVVDSKNDIVSDEVSVVLASESLYPGTWDQMWRNRLHENRMVMADQMDEVSKILQRFAQDLTEVTGLPELMEEELMASLRQHHILVKKLAVIERQGKPYEIRLTMKTRHNLCITTKEAAGIISEITKVPYVAQEGMRHVIPKDYETIVFAQDVSFHVLTGLARIAKNGERVNGDTFSFLRLRGGQMIMVLSDGMGSGARAYEESEMVIEMMENLLEAGFGEESAIRFVNSILVSRGEPKAFSTLDLCMLDLHTGVCQCLKNGASSTFIIREDHVETLYGEGLPIGMFARAEPETLKRKLYDGDLVVMVTDGVLDSLPGDDKEFYMENLLSNIQSNNPQEIANYILEHAIHQCGEHALDDMSVMVAGVWEKTGGRIE